MAIHNAELEVLCGLVKELLELLKGLIVHSAVCWRVVHFVVLCVSACEFAACFYSP